MEKPRVVILCGGKGTRLKEETEFRPKPLVNIGELPILAHIMKIYAHYGYDDFVLCLGYKGHMIKEYFLNFKWMVNDFTLKLRHGQSEIIHHTNRVDDLKITFADTGVETLTGGRIKKVEKYIDGDNFMATYGDGLADVNLNNLMKCHMDHGKIGTLTGVHPSSKYGTVDIDSSSVVNVFREKPVLKDLINGGFFVFKKDVFDYIKSDCMLEREPFKNLARDRQMVLYKHSGFWHSMDTFKDAQNLNKMWSGGNAPWKIWKD